MAATTAAYGKSQLFPCWSSETTNEQAKTVVDGVNYFSLTKLKKQIM